MRAVIFILIIAVVALLVAVATGFIDINQTRNAKAPDLSVNRSGVTAKAGRVPAFDVETGTVALGTKQKQVPVPVPTLRVNPPAPGNDSNQVTANAG